ncbi:GntR family transcriptional regulator [Actinopolymorpha singaporensis]|uniref:Transcriptional regulator, GntR family n=1 Tax=Actinopolymorpha singaporensis TaxID=117157 RepID=A0A1H1XND7_9ACTN|nr:GntR family transcriptional regulator [Actinopolymorpha singaporensis]SDT10682.1 transcriptional regulator, GntR family [Actinopolymorpha singaporensis]
MSRTRHEIDPSTLTTGALSAGRPKGHQLRKILEDLAGRLPPGALLPSERVLADHFEISRTTVRQEIQRLVTDGVLLRRHGHGTVVAEPRPAHTDLLTSFSRDMRARGLSPGSRVLSTSVEPSGPRIAARLEVEPGSPVLHLVRLRTADGDPMARESTDVSLARFPGLDEVAWEQQSLFDTLQERFGVRPATSEARICAVLPEPYDAELLEIGSGQPCLLIEAVTRDGAGHVLEAERSVYRGDRYDVLARARRAGDHHSDGHDYGYGYGYGYGYDERCDDPADWNGRTV